MFVIVVFDLILMAVLGISGARLLFAVRKSSSPNAAIWSIVSRVLGFLMIAAGVAIFWGLWRLAH